MKKLGLMYIILASVLWGTSGIFVHYMAPFGFTSLQMTFIRAIVSFLCMGVYVLIKDKRLVKTNLKESLLFLLGGFSFYMTATCYYYSMQLTSISTAVVLMYTAPIFVMIYSTTFLGEKLTPMKLISVAGMIVGCGLVSGIIGGMKFDVVGILVGFMSGISYAIYNIVTKIEMQKGINPIKANFYCFLFAVIGGAILSEPLGIIDCIRNNPPVTIPLSIGLGVVTCILPYFTYTMALRELPAGTASSLGILEPMAATIYSVLIFGEKISIYSFAGIILILASVIILGRQKQ